MCLRQLGRSKISLESEPAWGNGDLADASPKRALPGAGYEGALQSVRDRSEPQLQKFGRSLQLGDPPLEGDAAAADDNHPVARHPGFACISDSASAKPVGPQELCPIPNAPCVSR